MIKILKNIPFYILLITTLYSIVKHLLYNTFFTINNYLGIIGLIIVCIIFFKKYNWHKYSMILLLLFGTFNLLYFTYIIDTIGFYFNSKLFNIKTIEIQIFSFILLIVQLLLYRKEINNLFKSEESAIEKEKSIENKINSFEYKFKSKSEFDLNQIISNKNKFTKEAVKAAENLLKQFTSSPS